MKEFLFFVSVISVLFVSCTGGSKSSVADVEKPAYIPNPSGFEIYRGMNVSHWISQTGDWVDRATFFTEQDVKDLKAWGFDHIRLPVDEEIIFDTLGVPIDSSFRDLTNAIDWCIAHDMRVIVDLHILRSHHFNSRNNEGKMTLWNNPEAQERFFVLWDSLSARLHSYPNNMVAYEFMNEPVAPEHEMWNDLVTKVFQRIRALEPERVLMLGSNRWQKPHTFPYLEVPQNDPNIILTVHTYHPYFVTHYKAFWSPAKYYEGPVQYPGYPITQTDYDTYVDTTNIPLVSRIEEELSFEYFDKQKLADILAPAVAKAKEYNLQLYCSEFGCLPNVDRATRLRYYQDITDVFREHNVTYSSWDFKGNFGIVAWDSEARKNGSIDKELIDILVAW